MAKKLQNLESKLGSWTDQASLTRTQSVAPVAAEAPAAPPSRASYPVARSLLDRIAAVAEQQGLSQNEVVGHLLTWALDQVERGVYQLPGKTTD